MVSLINTFKVRDGWIWAYDDGCGEGTSLQATFNGLFQTGGFLGVFFVSWFADKYGRRVAIAVPAVILVVTAALMAGTTNVGEVNLYPI